MNKKQFESKLSGLLVEFNMNPPMLPSAIGSFLLEIQNYFHDMNVYFEDPSYDKDLFKTVAATVKTLLLIATQNFDNCSRYQNMEKTGPWSTIMGIFVVMSTLLVILEDKEKTKPWQINYSATQLNYILVNECCVSERNIKSYTVGDMLVALRLLSVNWYRLYFHDELRTYLYGLLHRACILVGHPSYANVHDCDEFRDETPTPNLYMANTDLVRLFSMQLIRMLVIIEFPRGRTSTPESFMQQNYIQGIRDFVRKQADVLSKTREARTEINVLFPRLMVNHGDSELFVKMRGMEKARPASLLMTIRPETQQANSQMTQFVMIERIPQFMFDDDVDYFEKWTRSQHAYSLLLKTYVINMPFKQYGIDFFNDYVIFEIDIPVFLNKITKHPDPLIIQLFGRLNVVFLGKLYMCSCIEHAISLWATIILEKRSGILVRKNIARALYEILGLINSATNEKKTDNNNNNNNNQLGDIIID